MLPGSLILAALLAALTPVAPATLSPNALQMATTASINFHTQMWTAHLVCGAGLLTNVLTTFSGLCIDYTSRPHYQRATQVNASI